MLEYCCALHYFGVNILRNDCLIGDISKAQEHHTASNSNSLLLFKMIQINDSNHFELI